MTYIKSFFIISAVVFFGGVGLSAHAAFPPGFVADPAYYPSTLNPNFLPNGTLVKTAKSPTVYYVKDGTKSMVLPRIVELWLKEAHYFKGDLIVTISDADMARYKVVKSVNPLYIGKILQAPDGKQYFIDDKLRRRPLSAAVRKALGYPSRNVYPASQAHINEFAAGAAITKTDVHPGGTVMYEGAYHGGTIWRIEENSKGQLTKRLYLQDYLYEAEAYPWSGQILPVTKAELARYPRGPHIERYVDGWVVGLNGKTYVVQKGTLRQIASPQIFAAMGYNKKYTLTVFPEFLKKYPIGTPIAAFKNIKAPAASAPAPKPASSSSSGTSSTSGKYPELRPAARALIGQINDLFLPIYDRDPSAAENVFWTDFVYKGEVGTKEALVAAMQKAKSTGKRPVITSRTAPLSKEALKGKWFSYLFYFVWHKEPTAEAKAYWYGRIDKGDWTTIEGLGGTMRYIQETTGKTHK